MKKINKDEIPFKHGSWGSKYFVSEKNYSFGYALITPGNEIKEHLHEDEKELFYFLKGSPRFIAGGYETRPSPGDGIIVDFSEPHALINDTEENTEMVIVKIRG